MTNGRRAKETRRRETSERRRLARYKLRHSRTGHEQFAYAIAWAADGGESAAVARKGTHDALIRMLGDRRAGGVEWLQWSGTEAFAVIRELRDDAGPDMQQLLTRIRRKLEEYDGVIVLAEAPVFPDDER